MFSISSAIGVPVVTCTPVSGCAITPDRIFTASGFLALGGEARLAGTAAVEIVLDVLGLSGSSGGQPSTTQPIATPWLSPKVVTRNMWPKVLKDILLQAVERQLRRVVTRAVRGVK